MLAVGEAIRWAGLPFPLSALVTPCVSLLHAGALCIGARFRVAVCWTAVLAVCGLDCFSGRGQPCYCPFESHAARQLHNRAMGQMRFVHRCVCPPPQAKQCFSLAKCSCCSGGRRGVRVWFGCLVSLGVQGCFFVLVCLPRLWPRCLQDLLCMRLVCMPAKTLYVCELGCVGHATLLHHHLGYPAPAKLWPGVCVCLPASAFFLSGVD